MIFFVLIIIFIGNNNVKNLKVLNETNPAHQLMLCEVVESIFSNNRNLFLYLFFLFAFFFFFFAMTLKIFKDWTNSRPLFAKNFLLFYFFIL
ncbi:hypothetical protein AMJ50_01185 [Parcubacteria bacterium DG_74_3]|nr:MAG: hypothetical protein AMJ50_01185 [Parcubacteria bacterium DG_74_3]